MKRIVIFLPANRAEQGMLNLFGDDRWLLAAMSCRGKADQEKATASKNPTRDPTAPFGDTPSGRFNVTKIVANGDPENAKGTHIGSFWIPLEGAGGQAATATRNGRKGLGIHGGRGDDDLVATYGCIRVRDSDFSRLRALVADGEILVTVEEF